jgi:hypothetical protein
LQTGKPLAERIKNGHTLETSELSVPIAQKKNVPWIQRWFNIGILTFAPLSRSLKVPYYYYWGETTCSTEKKYWEHHKKELAMLASSQKKNDTICSNKSRTQRPTVHSELSRGKPRRRMLSLSPRTIGIWYRRAKRNWGQKKSFIHSSIAISVLGDSSRTQRWGSSHHRETESA